MQDNSTHDEVARVAYASGVDAAKTAASWVADGNTDTAAIPAVLRMAEDGDPALWDYLPARPNLSGEWADDPTPLSLTRLITGDDDPSEALIDTVAEAFEEGVSDTFEAECVAELKSWLGDKS